MIGLLEGKPFIVSQDVLLIEVSGVGYRVVVTPKLLSHLGNAATVRLWIHTHVREDALDLFGFEDLDELYLFKALLTVSGVGPRTAILILNKEVVDIKQAVVEGDVDFFTGIPRLGKKNAQKVIIELRPKLASLALAGLPEEKGNRKEAIEALVAMGFTPKEARESLSSIPVESKTTEDRVRQALKILGHK